MIAAFFVALLAVANPFGWLVRTNATVPSVQQSGSGRWEYLTFHAGIHYFGAIGGEPSGQYVWLSDQAGNTLVRVKLDLTSSLFPLKVNGVTFTPGQFAFGADGTMYVGGCFPSSCAFIGVLSPDRTTFSVVPIPSGDGPGYDDQLVNGPDGNVWFIEHSHVGMITPQLAITEYVTGLKQVGGPNIVVGGDGNLWFDAGGFFSSSSGPPVQVGTVVPSTGAVKLKSLTLNKQTPFNGLTGMATDRYGRVVVLTTIVTSSAEMAYFDVLDRRFKQTIVPIGQTFEEGPASLIEGPGKRLWFGNPYCPGASYVGCSMVTYDPKSGHFGDLAAIQTWLGALSLAVAGDGNVWGICCVDFSTSAMPDRVLIYLTHHR